MEGRAPWREVPGESGDATDIDEALQRQAPVGKAGIGEADAYDAGEGDGGHLHNARLLHHQMSEEIGTLSGAEA